MEFSEPTRRHALWAIGAAGLAALAAADSVHQDAPRRLATPKGTPRPRAVLHPPPPPKPKPGWTQEELHALRSPAHNLADFTPPAPPNSVALTIDDGPHPLYTPQMLDLLAEHKVVATFSVIGIQVKEFPKLTRRIVEAGHQICNHTMTHPMPFNHLTPKRLRTEVVDCHARIADITGVTPKFFRSPGGSWSKRVLDTAHGQGMIAIDWDVDPRDWDRPGVSHIKRTMLAAQPGDILLCHDGGGDRSQTIKALRSVLPKLRKRGLSFVAL